MSSTGTQLNNHKNIKFIYKMFKLLEFYLNLVWLETRLSSPQKNKQVKVEPIFKFVKTIKHI